MNDKRIDLYLFQSIHECKSISIQNLIINRNILDIQKILWILSITKGIKELTYPTEQLISNVKSSCLSIGTKMNLIPRKDQIESCINICNDLLCDKNVILIGDTGTGKTFVKKLEYNL